MAHTNLHRLEEIVRVAREGQVASLQSATTIVDVLSSLLNSADEPILTEEGIFTCGGRVSKLLVG